MSNYCARAKPSFLALAQFYRYPYRARRYPLAELSFAIATAVALSFHRLKNKRAFGDRV